MFKLRKTAALFALGTLALIAGTAQADTMNWTSTSYLVSSDPASGTFVRRGVAMFKNGDVATFTTEARITERQGSITSYTAKVSYRFEDGSTLLQEGQGRNEPLPPAGIKQTGAGKLVGGTGRFEGISGTTESTGRALNDKDSINEFKAEYTITKK